MECRRRDVVVRGFGQERIDHNLSPRRSEHEHIQGIFMSNSNAAVADLAVGKVAAHDAERARVIVFVQVDLRRTRACGAPGISRSYVGW